MNDVKYSKEELLTMAKHIASSNKRVIDETQNLLIKIQTTTEDVCWQTAGLLEQAQNLIRHIDRSTKEAIWQCKENIRLHRYDSEKLEELLEKINA